MATRKKASTSTRKTAARPGKTSNSSARSGAGKKSPRAAAGRTTSKSTRTATGSTKRRTSEATSVSQPRLTRRPPEAAELEKANPASRGARKKEETIAGPASIVSKRDGALDSYLITLEPTAKQVVTELRKIVSSALPKATEAIRWRNLCWEHDGIVCFASAAKKHVTLGFFHGAELTDPDNLLEKVKNKTERVVKLKDVNDINAAQITAWVREAAKLNSKR